MTDELRESVLEDLLFYAISEYMQYWDMSAEEMNDCCKKVIKESVLWNRIRHDRQYDMCSSYPSFILNEMLEYRNKKDILSSVYGMIYIDTDSIEVK